MKSIPNRWTSLWLAPIIWVGAASSDAAPEGGEVDAGEAGRQEDRQERREWSPGSLAALAVDKHPAIGRVEVHGDRPTIVYVPIIHTRVRQHRRDDIRQVMRSCEKIAGHLHREYGVRNIMLEGMGTNFADYYNGLGEKDQPVSKPGVQLTIQTWFDILNANRWKMIPAFEKMTHGPLGSLGAEYKPRIIRALNRAKKEGWLRSRAAYNAHRDDLQGALAEACDGYNEKQAAILKEDPEFRREYDFVVRRVNKVFLDNLLAADGPAVLFCGRGHARDLVKQMVERKAAHVLVVPRGMDLSPKEDDPDLRPSMATLCPPRTVTLKFGDGSGSAKVKIPIDPL